MSFPSEGADDVSGAGGAAGAGVETCPVLCAQRLLPSNRQRSIAANPNLSAPRFLWEPMSCLALPEEHRTEIGSVNLRVTHRARLVLCRLVVGRSDRLARSPVHVGRMATKAQEVDVVHLQQTWVGRAMRGVT